MNEEIILVAETGSDLTPQQAQENGIYLVPMHVTMGDQTLDDGSFPPEEVCAYYQKTGTVPKPAPADPSILRRCSTGCTSSSRTKRFCTWPTRR